jgi:hypothetical protein
VQLRTPVHNQCLSSNEDAVSLQQSMYFMHQVLHFETTPACLLRFVMIIAFPTLVK